MRLYIGLDVGRTIRGALIDELGAILLQRKVVSEVRSADTFLNQIVDVILRLKAEAHGPVTAAGIGWPGLVNQHANRLEATPNQIDLSSLEPYRRLREAAGLPVLFDNDANAGAYGEWRCGIAQGFSNVLYVAFGTGIGGALILGGELQRGCRGFAGEFGHFKIEVTGLECGCGSSGCLETLASGPNIVRRVRERLFSDPAFSVSQLAQDMEGTLTLERIVRAATEADELGLSVLRETAVYLGMALASAVNLLNVEMVVVGGGVMAAGELLLGPLREETMRRTIAPAAGCCRIVAGELGRDAGIVGAAMFARDANR